MLDCGEGYLTTRSDGLGLPDAGGLGGFLTAFSAAVSTGLGPLGDGGGGGGGSSSGFSGSKTMP